MNLININQILEYLGVDYIDESEVLTIADEENHINKHDFEAPFVCGARDLGEALRRISEVHPPTFIHKSLYVAPNARFSIRVPP